MKKCLAMMTILALIAVLAAGCTGTQALPTPMSPTPVQPPAPSEAPLPSEAPASVSTDPADKVNFRLLISDEVNAIEDFEHLYVTISSISVHQGGESGEWHYPTVIPDPDEDEMDGIDLRPLEGLNALVIWEGTLPEGEYTKVVIYVTDVTGIPADNDDGEASGGVDDEPTEISIKLPSEKLQISRNFTIGSEDEDQVVNFVYDITVVKAGQSGKYILKPQIAESGPNQEFVDVTPMGNTERHEEKNKEKHEEKNKEKHEDELQLQLEGEPTLGAEVTLIVTDGESQVEGATVTINDEKVMVTEVGGEVVEAKTDVDGRLTIVLPDTPGKVKIEATFEDKSGELEIELEEK